MRWVSLAGLFIFMAVVILAVMNDCGQNKRNYSKLEGMLEQCEQNYLDVIDRCVVKSGQE